jgi:hypothetical protein
MKPLYATVPSAFVDLPDADAASRLRDGLFNLANYFSDARLAKELFADATARYQAKDSTLRDRARRESQMYAREFIFALDYFVKELFVMTEHPSAPPPLKKILADFNSRVPGIVDLRDSLHHLEDRLRGMARNKRIKPQPLNKHKISGSALVVTHIVGSTIVATSANGSHAEVHITRNTLEEMIVTLQQTINALPWRKGTPQRIPRTDF